MKEKKEGMLRREKWEARPQHPDTQLTQHRTKTLFERLSLLFSPLYARKEGNSSRTASTCLQNIASPCFLSLSLPFCKPATHTHTAHTDRQTRGEKRKWSEVRRPILPIPSRDQVLYTCKLSVQREERRYVKEKKAREAHTSLPAAREASSPPTSNSPPQLTCLLLHLLNTSLTVKAPEFNS